MGSKQFNLLLLAILSVVLITCGGGGAGNPNGTTPPPTVVPVTTPESTNIMANTPVGFGESYQTISVLGTNGYSTYSLPESVQSILGATPPESINTIVNPDSTVITTPDKIIVAIPNNLTTSIDTQIYTIPPSVKLTTFNSIQPSLPGTLNSGVTFGGLYQSAPSIIKLNPAGSVEYRPLNGNNGCPSVTGIPTTLKLDNYIPNTYYGVGTSQGAVCVLTTHDSLINQGNFTNVSAQAPTRYESGMVDNFGYIASGRNLFGYWLVGNNVWRVTALYQSANVQPIPNSFWNLTDYSLQATTDGTGNITFTGFNGGPQVVVSMQVDVNNTVYVGSNNGYVYKLISGFTGWGGKQVSPNATGNVYLTPTINNVGVSATTTIESTSAVFTVN